MTDWFAPSAPTVGFTGSPLDRADAMRKDDAAMIMARADRTARWLVLDDLRPVVDDDGSGGDALRWFARGDIPTDAPSVFLGLAALWFTLKDY